MCHVVNGHKVGDHSLGQYELRNIQEVNELHNFSSLVEAELAPEEPRLNSAEDEQNIEHTVVELVLLAELREILLVALRGANCKCHKVEKA